MNDSTLPGNSEKKSASVRHFKVISVVLAALEPYQNLIHELFDSGQTYAEISAALQRSGATRCSVMSVRRFCMEQNLRRQSLVSDTELQMAVVSSIRQVCGVKNL